MPGGGTQHLIEFRLARLVEGRGCLVEEQQIGLGQKDAREGQALLLAHGQPLCPVVVFIQARRETREPYRGHGLGEFGISQIAAGPRIDQRLAQGAERQIGLLRQEQQLAGHQPDRALAVRPDAGDGAQQRTFASAGRAGHQHSLAGLGIEIEA